MKQRIIGAIWWAVSSDRNTRIVCAAAVAAYALAATGCVAGSVFAEVR